MGRSTTHYADGETNKILKTLHNRLRQAGTPIERVEYAIELLLLRIFETKIRKEKEFAPLRKLFTGKGGRMLFSDLCNATGAQILTRLNGEIFPFYAEILSKARPCIEGNLSHKLQDQLVLMEEVFANSNFTNNVQTGILSEVLSLIGEIREESILKTDLLGDAIEAALSETGGTKDFGLYRTPDHIRKMMVGMVEPKINDIIFDPACGTAGFLFDANDYIFEQIKKSGKVPEKNALNRFHRSGIGGIEYQGRIRKMAAVNMYIRGLNPHNIQQGDSLQMYKAADENSKTVILANPPFGAERDQEAYPNIWEEYSTEGETTILFVKLMFDLLREGGRCAVVVSDGFLTWKHRSACALRKMLLNNANLKAVISLPQGVFVSKSGQGAKTSILYFEKGAPTDAVWFCKIENDGFSIGTNRSPIEGNQIPELLEGFSAVKQNKKAAETKRSFYVAKEQIETLDPRIVLRIQKKTAEKVKEKFSTKREKLLESLQKKLSSEKIDQAQYDAELAHFDSHMEDAISVEIASAIEKENTRHFNLQKYRSNLNPEQMKKWTKILPASGAASKRLSIAARYDELLSANPDSALKIIATFDCKNALHMDIAREYLNKMDGNILARHEKLAMLKDILTQNFQHPFEVLDELLYVKENKISLDDETLYKQITVKSYGKGVTLRQEILGKNIKTKEQFRVDAGDFIISKISAEAGPFGIVPNFLDGAIVSSEFPVFGVRANKVHPKYLELAVTRENFYLQIADMVSGGGRRRVDVDDFLNLQIPLPPMEIQEKIAAELEASRKLYHEAAQIKEKTTEKILAFWVEKSS